VGENVRSVLQFVVGCVVLSVVYRAGAPPRSGGGWVVGVAQRHSPRGSTV